MDLSLRLGRIKVTILPSFFIVAALLGMTNDLRQLAVWTLVVLVSVLWHELGHSAMGLAFGLQPSIVLHGMGGTTSWAAGRPMTPGRSIAISLAGPFAGFVFGAVVLGAGMRGWIPDTPLGRFAYGSLLYVNVGWGALNLLPMLPLDGGNVLRQSLVRATRGRPEKPAHIVSLVVAVSAGLYAALVLRDWWPALLAAMFAASNWTALQRMSASARAATPGPPPPDAPPPERLGDPPSKAEG